MNFDIYLRPFKFEDAIHVNNLRRIEASEAMIGGFKRPVGLERDKKWVENIIMGDSQTVIYFAISPIGSEDFIGYTSISEIDYRNGSCFWSGIKVDQIKSGKGIGTQICLLILKFVFEEMRMERCKGICIEEHAAMLHILTKVGYKQEGLMRHSLYKNGKFNDQWLLSIIREEYLLTKEKFGI